MRWLLLLLVACVPVVRMGVVEPRFVDSDPIGEVHPDNPGPDDDGDGIRNDDRCPRERETFNGYEDVDGCPDDLSWIVCRDPGSPFQRIYFKKGDRVAPKHPVLVRAAMVLREWPELRVAIVGHADVQEAGNEESRVRIGLRRAEAVRDRLMALGFAAQRFEVRTYGATWPDDKSATARGRARNRRVEFVVLSAP